MGRVRKYFEDKGIAASDVPRAIVLFKLLTYATYVSSLVLCYRCRPLVSFFRLSGPQRMLQRFRARHQERYDRYQAHVMEKSRQLSEWRWFKPIPRFFGANSQRLTLALAENFVFYKCTLPITIPLQVWFTIKLISNRPSDVSMLETFEAHLEEEEEKSGAGTTIAGEYARALDAVADTFAVDYAPDSKQEELAAARAEGAELAESLPASTIQDQATATKELDGTDRTGWLWKEGAPQAPGEQRADR